MPLSEGEQAQVQAQIDLARVALEERNHDVAKAALNKVRKLGERPPVADAFARADDLASLGEQFWQAVEQGRSRLTARGCDLTGTWSCRGLRF